MRLLGFAAPALAAGLISVASVGLLRAQSVRGTIVDSASSKGVANARVGVGGTTLQATADSLGRFTIAGAPSGEQVLVIHTRSLDSLNAGYSAPITVGNGITDVAVRVPSALQIAATACGDRGYGTGGIVLGRLRVAEDSTASLAGTVSAEWRTAGGNDSSKWVSAMSDARGRFALCGVPTDVALSLRAATSAANGQASDVRVPSTARFGRAEIMLHRAATTTATFAGVVTDSANRPILGVEVALPDLGRGTVTNEQGAFALPDVPAGTQHIVVRHLGYGPIESQLMFVGGQTVQRHITMARATALDSVVVTERAVDHYLGDFEDNRRLGLGHFLTRADLAPQENQSTGATLATLPGIRMAFAGPYAWAGSARHNATSMSGAVVLDDIDLGKHAPLLDCYALVYVDDHPVWIGRKFPGGNRIQSAAHSHWEPLFDINSIPVAEIEAIEYYASAAETPARYLTLNSQCGVLVIHTLRFHPKDTTAANGKPPAR